MLFVLVFFPLPVFFAFRGLFLFVYLHDGRSSFLALVLHLVRFARGMALPWPFIFTLGILWVVYLGLHPLFLIGFRGGCLDAISSLLRRPVFVSGLLVLSTCMMVGSTRRCGSVSDHFRDS